MCAPMPCPDAVLKKEEMGADSWLSLLGMVSDLCCSQLQPPSLPSMCLSILGLASDLCSQTGTCDMMLPSAHYLEHPPQYLAPASTTAMLCTRTAQEAKGAVLLPMPRSEESAYPTATCSAEALPPPTPTAKVCITANAHDSQVEMSINDDEACLTCKKLIVKVGGRQLTLTTVDGKVHIRAAELDGEADCVRTDGKDHLILEGNAVLRSSKAGQQVQVLKGERIELHLATIVSVTVESAGKFSCH